MNAFTCGSPVFIMREQHAAQLGHVGSVLRVAGATFGVAVPALPIDSAAIGSAYGLAVWAGSYLRWLPAAGVHPPATEEAAGKNAVMGLAHVVRGAALGVLTDRPLQRAIRRGWRPGCPSSLPTERSGSVRIYYRSSTAVAAVLPQFSPVFLQ